MAGQGISRKNQPLNSTKINASVSPSSYGPLVALIRHVLQVTILRLIVYSCLQGGYRGNVYHVQDAVGDVFLAGASPDVEARVMVWIGHGRGFRPVGEPGLDVKPDLD